MKLTTKFRAIASLIGLCVIGLVFEAANIAFLPTLFAGLVYGFGVACWIDGGK